MILKERFAVPAGAQRVEAPAGTFGAYLQNLPLYPTDRKVHYFDGREKFRSEVAAAVIRMDVGDRDLQQCADAVMRLRAEYLFAAGRYADISFEFTNGFPAPYAKWRAGNRIQVKGNQVSWYPVQRPSTSYESFRKYLNMVFAYAGTISLRREMVPVQASSLQIGDVLIQAGSPGHAVIVVDKAVDEAQGGVYFMLVQSYMPAQDLHVLTNPNAAALSPWYEFKATEPIHTPEWNFEWVDLYRFTASN
ncbi:MAG: DUF4846 domain-containing protein [Phaeodactylibacter sp.]|nr:DUF4846 domain-containing protein [Phaeodactylibacter sp.]